MSKITEDSYQKAIPPWCFYKTAQEHIDSLLGCWTITSKIEAGESVWPKDCGFCECNTNVTNVMRRKQLEQQKIWKVLAE